MPESTSINDLQEDIDRTREELGDTVDALKKKMHPEPVVPIGVLGAAAAIIAAGVAVWLWRRR